MNLAARWCELSGLPEKGDLSDWVETLGHTGAEVRAAMGGPRPS
jgi:hypothetical protein